MDHLRDTSPAEDSQHAIEGFGEYNSPAPPVSNTTGFGLGLSRRAMVLATVGAAVAGTVPFSVRRAFAETPAIVPFNFYWHELDRGGHFADFSVWQGDVRRLSIQVAMFWCRV